MNLDLIGTRKMAALLMVLDKGTASVLLRTLPEKRITEIGRAMIELRNEAPQPADQARLLAEFYEAMVSESANVDPLARLREALQATFGDEHARDMVETVEGEAYPTEALQAMEEIEPATIAQALEEEHPQTAALFLMQLDPERAAEILTHLPEIIGTDLIVRMASKPAAPPDIIRQVVLSLSERTVSKLTGDDTKLRRIAQIFNRFPSERCKTILDAIGEASPELASRLSDLRFTFEDFRTLDRKSLQKALAGVDTSLLARSLFGMDDGFKDRVLQNVSKRIRERVEEELGEISTLSPKDVAAARKEIVKSVMNLADLGQIDLSKRE